MPMRGRQTETRPIITVFAAPPLPCRPCATHREVIAQRPSLTSALCSTPFVELVAPLASELGYV